MTTTAHSASHVRTSAETRWRTIDIVVAAVIGVAFGVVFWAWDAAWTAVQPAFAGFKPAEYIISGVWLLPAVVAPLIVRKPGAALFAELVAAIVSALLGNTWGLDVVLSGFAQGAAAELVFAFTLYRSFSLPVAIVAAAAAGVAEAIHDLPIYYPEFSADLQVATIVAAVVSGAVIAGIGGWFLVRALRQTGVLEPFAEDR